MDTRGNSVWYPISPLALAFPEMPDSDFLALKRDIRENGLIDPIDVLDQQVEDGRHRQRACKQLGIDPKYNFLPVGTDPLKHIVSKNKQIRHTNSSQDAITAARVYLLSLEESRQEGGHEGSTGSESAILQIAPLTQVEACELLGVRQRTFSHAVSVLASNCSDSLVMAIEQGRIRVSDAQKVCGQPVELQEAAVATVLQGGARTVSAAVNLIRWEKDKGGEPEPPVVESWSSPDGNATLYNCDISRLLSVVDRESVDVIIGHVPHGKGAAKTLRELRDFTFHALRDTGLAVLLCRTQDLPEAFRHLWHKEIEYIFEVDYRVDLPTRPLGGRHGIVLRRMPLLVFGKSMSTLDGDDDVLQLPPLTDASTEVRLGERHAAGSELIVRRFAVSGGLVCDPLLMGGANNALAAVRSGCRFVGCCRDQGKFEYVRNRLALACAEKDG